MPSTTTVAVSATSTWLRPFTTPVSVEGNSVVWSEGSDGVDADTVALAANWAAGQGWNIVARANGTTIDLPTLPPALGINMFAGGTWQWLVTISSSISIRPHLFRHNWDATFAVGPQGRIAYQLCQRRTTSDVDVCN